MTTNTKHNVSDLRDRLRTVINDFCNQIGCNDCSLKFGFENNSPCSATDLERQIQETEEKDRK